MSNTKDLTPPTGTPEDTAHLVARTVLGFVPTVGGSFKEMFNALISPPIEKRKSEWMESVGKAIYELRDRVEKLEDLSKDNEFIDTVIRASQIAITTSQKEKIKALKNVIINSALPGAPDQSLRQLFLTFVESFTEWHLHLLKLSRDPVEFFKKNPEKMKGVNGASFLLVVWRAFPKIEDDLEEFIKAVWLDLYSKGLVSQENINLFMSNPMNKKTTKLGDQFLDFIESK